MKNLTARVLLVLSIANMLCCMVNYYREDLTGMLMCGLFALVSAILSLGDY